MCDLKKKNTYEYFYKSSCIGLEMIYLNWFGGKLYISAVNTTEFHHCRE